MSGRRRGRSARDALLVLALGTLAIIAAVAWMAEHLIVFAGVALLMWSVLCLGRHERTRARPGQIQPRQARPEEPAVAAALPVATLPLADYRDEPGAEQRPADQAGRDRHARTHLTESDESITAASGRSRASCGRV